MSKFVRVEQLKPQKTIYINVDNINFAVQQVDGYLIKFSNGDFMNLPNVNFLSDAVVDTVVKKGGR